MVPQHTSRVIGSESILVKVGTLLPWPLTLEVGSAATGWASIAKVAVKALGFFSRISQSQQPPTYRAARRRSMNILLRGWFDQNSSVRVAPAKDAEC